MTRAIPLLVLLAACGPSEDTDVSFTQTSQTLDEGACDLIDEFVLGMDDASPEIFTPNDALNQLENSVAGTLEWPDSLTAGFTTTLVYESGDVTWRERDVTGAATLGLIEECITAMEIPMVFTMQSSNFAFDEVVDIILQATARDIARFSFVLPSADLMGGWTPEMSGLDLSGYTSWEFEFVGQATDAGTSGEITLLVDAGDGVIGRLPVATWAPPVSPSR